MVYKLQALNSHDVLVGYFRIDEVTETSKPHGYIIKVVGSFKAQRREQIKKIQLTKDYEVVMSIELPYILHVDEGETYKFKLEFNIDGGINYEKVVY